MREFDKLDFELPKREQNSHKGTYGKVLNIAGSRYMPGAAYLSSVSALKIGCGYCFLCSEESVLSAVANQTQNVVFVPYKDMKKQLKTADVVSIGCGLSTSFRAKQIFKTALKNIGDTPVVIDADGLNILAKEKVKLPKKLILTPHPTEAARLLNVTTEDILQDLELSAKEIAKKYNCVVALKTHNTVVTDGEKVYINNSGNSALAKAGSGDVLTGMIAGLLAQGMDLFEATKLSVYLHGLSGELASKRLTEYGVMASDLISLIPNALYCRLRQSI